ncbi:hypothetical protein [Janthinobacterium sp. ROICE36]|uniref:hypothetical protein n=1 Tax=Janthinobacterium sp. ROICE36 TaxID=2048670 RepID=UPI0011AF267D|nr:hypothetical protein [Janthinobacterium sp. ROICE36]
MSTVLLPPHYEGSALIACSTQLYRGHAANRLAPGYRRQHRRRLDAMLDGKLEQVLQTFGEVLWLKAA